MTNKMNNIPQWLKFEDLYGLEGAASGRHMMFGPEKRSVRWVRALVAKFSGAGDLVVDFCAG